MARYQGATVRHWQTGRGFYNGGVNQKKRLLHVDVSSQYPSGMIVLNLSPESIRLDSIKPYTGTYKFDADTGYIEVPDENYGQVCCYVDTTRDSVTRTELIDLFKQKTRIKRQLKTCAVERRAELDALYNFVKVQLNSRYGYNGLMQSMYGNVLVAIVTTAFGRLVIQTIIHVCETLGVQPLECDTDGLYCWAPPNFDGQRFTDTINEHLHDMFKGWYWSNRKIKDDESGALVHIGINVELDEHDGMLIYKMKNYILYDRLADGKDELTFKGSGFHGRSMPPLCSTALKRFALALFRGENLDSVWLEYADLKKLPLREFAMNVSFNKKEYEGDNLYVKLLAQFSDDDRKYVGNEVTYVRIRGKAKKSSSYVPLGVIPNEELHRRLDYDYYRDRLRTCVNERLLTPYRPHTEGSLLNYPS